MTGHIVGLDPMTGMIVVLRKGQDGKASRQVDVLTESEALTLTAELEGAIVARRSIVSGKPHPHASIRAAPEPEQTAFDLDGLIEGDHA